jgi:predicted ArsR family transcriptional regulator
MSDHQNRQAGLHPQREAVLQFILGLDYSPTVAEVAEAVGLSTGGAFRQIELLEAEGRIERRGPARRIVVRREGG